MEPCFSPKNFNTRTFFREEKKKTSFIKQILDKFLSNNRENINLE